MEAESVTSDDSPPFAASVTTLKSSYTGADIYLVGTAHVSNASAQEVIETIQKVQPDAVLIELCPSRVSLLLAEAGQQKREVSLSDITQTLKSGQSSRVFHMLLAWALQSATRDINVEMGNEMRVAYQEAMKLGIPTVLIDRPVEITLKRAWDTLSKWEKIKLVFSIFATLILGLKITEEEVESMKNGDILSELLSEMAAYYPNASRVLVTERDQYLALRLRSFSVPKIVGVVGMGHVSGITKYWNDDSINIKELLTIQPKEPRKSWKKWIAATAVVATSYLVYLYLL